jgi:ABC-type transporter Mla subunit MlaD
MPGVASSYHDGRNGGKVDEPFVAAFVIGVCLVAFFYFHRQYQLLPEVSLLVVMIAYAIIHIASSTYEGREDKLGDNLYYLGFLFTISSLMSALIAFSASGVDVSNLVQSFGIALVTTMIGMLLRLLAYQVYGGREVTVESAMRQLGDEVRLVGMQLRTTADSIGTSYEKINAAMDGAQQNFTGNLNTMSGRLAQADTALDGIVTQMSGVSDRLAAVDIPKDLLTEKLTPITRSLVNNAKRTDQASALIADGIDKVNATVMTLDANSAQLSDTLVKLASVRDELEPLLELIRRICNEVDQLGSQLSRSSEAISSAAARSADTLTLLAERSAGDATLVARHREEMERELERTRIVMRETSDAFRPLAAMVREREETEAKVTASYRAELERQLGQIRELHDELQTNAVALIKFIAGNLANDRIGT